MVQEAVQVTKALEVGGSSCRDAEPRLEQGHNLKDLLAEVGLQLRHLLPGKAGLQHSRMHTRCLRVAHAASELQNSWTVRKAAGPGPSLPTPAVTSTACVVRCCPLSTGHCTEPREPRTCSGLMRRALWLDVQKLAAI